MVRFPFYPLAIWFFSFKLPRIRSIWVSILRATYSFRRVYSSSGADFKLSWLCLVCQQREWPPAYWDIYPVLVSAAAGFMYCWAQNSWLALSETQKKSEYFNKVTPLYLFLMADFTNVRADTKEKLYVRLSYKEQRQKLPKTERRRSSVKQRDDTACLT